MARYHWPTEDLILNKSTYTIHSVAQHNSDDQRQKLDLRATYVRDNYADAGFTCLKHRALDRHCVFQSIVCP